jgi:hypothetical protein
MKKNDLVGKFILYQDKNYQERTEKVTKIVGNVVTVINCLKEKVRVHPEQIVGVYIKTKHLTKLTREDYIEKIDWGNSKNVK